jgi:hypothetical protein
LYKKHWAIFCVVSFHNSDVAYVHTHVTHDRWLGSSLIVIVIGFGWKVLEPGQGLLVDVGHGGRVGRRLSLVEGDGRVDDDLEHEAGDLDAEKVHGDASRLFLGFAWGQFLTT